MQSRFKVLWSRYDYSSWSLDSEKRTATDRPKHHHSPLGPDNLDLSNKMWRQACGKPKKRPVRKALSDKLFQLRTCNDRAAYKDLCGAFAKVTLIIAMIVTMTITWCKGPSREPCVDASLHWRQRQCAFLSDVAE